MAKKILIVDDERDYVELLSNILAIHGYEISVAYDGQEAMDALNNEIPDLIILDIKMPRLNGYEVCKLLANNARYKNIPFLILTACGEFDNVKLGIATAAVSYIVKPFKQEVLLGLVHGLIEQKPLF